MCWLDGIARRYTITSTVVHKDNNTSIGELLNAVTDPRDSESQELRLGVVGLLYGD
jgi:hypothetical protein